MNLEQIKETQEILNHHLSKVLEELRAVVNFIAGDVSILGKKEKDNLKPNGIVEEISCTQVEIHSTIKELESQVDKLVKATYNKQDLSICKMSD